MNFVVSPELAAGNSYLSVLPPLVILILGFTTRRILLSLCCGVLSASFIATGYDFGATLLYAGGKLLATLEVTNLLEPSSFWQSWNLFICFFLFSLGILITLIHHSGGAFAYESFIKGRLRKRKHVEVSSLMLSSCLFIDDYFSNLTVGSVMRPITDAYRIPRAKLAFLVDVMAAPLTILCPVSSWVAAIVGFLRDNGVKSNPGEGVQVLGSPFLAYLNILPYLFYSFVVLMGVWFIVLRRLSFGLMGQHEQVARTTGNVFNGRNDGLPAEAVSGRKSGQEDSAALRDFFIPVAFLILSIFAGILYSGDSQLFGGRYGLAEALRQAAAAKGLFLGGSLALALSTAYYLARGKVQVRELPSLAREGFSLMLPATQVLMLAWTLGGILRQDLGTGHYLAAILTSSLPEQLLPLMFFLASLVTAFAIGSSWGTAAVMFPIAIQMIVGLDPLLSVPALMSDLPLLFPVLGAVLSGALAGNHISPISDSTIMAATSTAMLHSDHLETQMGYVLPLIGITACSFLCLGCLISFGTVPAFCGALVVSAALVLGVLSQLHGRRPLPVQQRARAKV